MGAGQKLRSKRTLDIVGVLLLPTLPGHIRASSGAGSHADPTMSTTNPDPTEASPGDVVQTDRGAATAIAAGPREEIIEQIEQLIEDRGER